MATVTVAANQVGVHNLALSAGVVEVVQFGQDVDQVEVTQISGSDPIYFTTDGSTPAVPSAGAASACFSTLAPLLPVLLDPRTWQATSIRLVCASAASVSVVRA
jgi:hypothetical protein